MVSTSAPEDPYHSHNSFTATIRSRTSSLRLTFSRLAWFFLLTSLMLITRLQLNPRIVAPEAYFFTLSLTGFAVGLWLLNISEKRTNSKRWRLAGILLGLVSIFMLVHSLLSF